MIREIEIKNSMKKNWLDDRGILVGYDAEQQCCEDFGWGVYEKESGRKVASTPNGMPYHFARYADEEPQRHYVEGARESTEDECNDYVLVYLLPDDEADKEKPILVFEFYNCHNGYYSHDFEMKVDFTESKPEVPSRTVTEEKTSLPIRDDLPGKGGHLPDFYSVVKGIHELDECVRQINPRAFVEVKGGIPNGIALKIELHNGDTCEFSCPIRFGCRDEFMKDYRIAKEGLVRAIESLAERKKGDIRQIVSDVMKIADKMD